MPPRNTEVASSKTQERRREMVRAKVKRKREVKEAVEDK